VKRSVLGNLVTHGAATGSNIFLFLLAAVAARYLGPDDFGIFSFALAFVFFFDFILDPGLYHLFIREIARNRPETARYVRQGMTWKIVAGPIAFALMAIGVSLLHESPRIHNVVYLMGLAAILKSAKDIYVSALLANERFGLNAISAFLERGGLLVAGVAVLMAGFGLLALCWTFVVVRAIDLVVIRQMTLVACGRDHGGVDWGFLKSLIWAGAPIGALYVTLNLYNYIDTVMISVLRNQTETGWYGASFRVYEGLRMVPEVVGIVLLPRLSRAYRSASSDLGRLVSIGYRYVLLFGLLVSGVGVLLSADIIGLAFGEDYSPAVPALAILVAGVPFVFIVHFLQLMLIAMDRQRVLLSVALFGLVANVGLNAIVIPLHGYLGAAFTTVAVEAVVCGVLTLVAHRSGALSETLFKAMAAVGCWLAAGAVTLGPLAVLPPYLQAFSFAAVLVALLWLVRSVDASDLGWLVRAQEE
jgi:O-antigen/teichoic acid export membrane protein